MINIVGLVSGLAVTVLLIPSLGLIGAFIVGVFAGGVVGAFLTALRGKSSSPTNNAQETKSVEYDQKEIALDEVMSGLNKVKKIRVSGKEAKYHDEVIVNIEKGNAQACWTLGECFLNGRILLSDPFPKDKASALFWFRKSAQLGLAASQYHLGVMYLGDVAWQLGMGYSEDEGIEKNLDESVKWLNLAASQSDHFSALAQDVLGEMYFSGIVFNQDHARAFALFSKSVANPENMNLKFGTYTHAGERIPTLKAEGYT